MKRTVGAALTAAMMLLTAPAAFATDRLSGGSPCIFRFSEPISEEVRIAAHKYVDLFFLGNYGTDAENLRVVTDPIGDVTQALGDEDIDFYDFVGRPKFASPVKVAIDADESSFLYEYRDGEVYQVPDTAYESDAWTFETKKLGVYFLTEQEVPLGPLAPDAN